MTLAQQVLQDQQARLVLREPRVQRVRQDQQVLRAQPVQQDLQVLKVLPVHRAQQVLQDQQALRVR